MAQMACLALAMVAVFTARRLAGVQTSAEACTWLFAGAARDFAWGTAAATIARVRRGGEPEHMGMPWATEVINSGVRSAAEFLQIAAEHDETNYRYMRRGFELVAYSSAKAMEKAGYTTFDYVADGVPCRAVCPKRLVPDAKKHLGLAVSSEERNEARTWHERTPHAHQTSEKPLKWLLHFHGGGYVSGTMLASQAVGWHYGEHALDRPSPLNMVVVLPDYALAPEARFPAAVIDAVRAFAWHVAPGRMQASQVVLAGESAGGGLVAATLLALRDGLNTYITNDDINRQGNSLQSNNLANKGAATAKVCPKHVAGVLANAKLPMPAGAIIMSPLLDLRHDALYCAKRANRDVLTAGIVNGAARTYVPLAHVAASNPLASPILSKLHDMPPLMLTAGDAEIFMPHIEDFYAKAKAHNSPDADISFFAYPDKVHSFQLQWESGCEQSRDLYEHAMRFVERVTAM
ncbi:Neutral cholesterol ester hydrolase 1 [Hondaea fermentalgiana]|uniref:Neutral cholesterol ester hydrolase 1 n=1 Tax=Hondaea fermentalgiana TaxID=2315210 RepID=A0A2R5G5I0_9STRA|nr:Neutral cholesterol ester hydrolase 1 [Hondaea fermentalgiana]|eukprot:GBG25038.1 Neutral cholesterol ester hydrolase 1 [Hondaea fermentalgiana]